MNEATRLRELEAECRQRALSEPDKKWYWLAQAAKYQVQASQKIAFRSEDANAADSRKSNWRSGRMAAMSGDRWSPLPRRTAKRPGSRSADML